MFFSQTTRVSYVFHQALMLRLKRAVCKLVKSLQMLPSTVARGQAVFDRRRWLTLKSHNAKVNLYIFFICFFMFFPLSTGSTRRIHSSYAYLFHYLTFASFSCQALVKKRIKYGLRDRRGVLCQCHPKRFIKLAAAELMILVTLWGCWCQQPHWSFSWSYC